MKAHLVLLTLSLVILISGLAMAQPALPSPPSQAPIDGGLSLLAAAGGAYAYKKLRDKRKGNDKESTDF